MVVVLNCFMECLFSSNEILCVFMVEVVYQMCMLLVVLCVQVQLVLDDDDLEDMWCSLQVIECNVMYMSWLFNQLFSDVSVIYCLYLQCFVVVDLVEMVYQVLYEVLLQVGLVLCVQLVMIVELVQVYGDVLLLCEVIKNLVDNVMKYGGDGLLQIVLIVEGGQVVLIIVDYGVGIVVVDVECVFECFVCGEGVLFGGVGLGLVIVKCVVDSYGGCIDFSNCLQGGFIVIICLLWSSL